MNRKKNRRPMPGHDVEDMYDVINLPKTIKFSLNQLDHANERKRKAGYRNFSTFARDCILNTQIVERVTPEQMRILNELIREGNNLNQIAKACNSGRCFAVASQATAVLKRHNALIDLFYEIKTYNMFAKIRKGNGFGGCLDYITRVKQDDKPIEKRVWKILDSDGVRIADGEKDWRKRAAADIERPTLSRSKIKDPCGHIALGFAPEDAHRLTDEFMTQVAKEYMEAMGIKNTPYVIVRHSDADHPHCHLMFSRVDYDGKIIKPVTNWHRNKRVCRDITERHGLTIAEDSLSLDTSKLRGAEKSRIEIRQIGHEVLKDKSITDWPTFQRRMKERGVNVKCLWKDPDAKKLEIKTLIYAKGNHSFIASKIGKDYTPTGLLSQFEANLKSQMAPTAKAAPTAPTPAAAPQPQAPAITLSTPSLGSQSADDTNMVLGGGLSDDFAHFLKMHPGLSIEEAKRKFKEQQKLKAQQRRGPKIHR